MAEDAPLLRESGRGLSIHYKNRNLYNPADPTGGALRRIPNTLTANTLYILFSPLLGYGIRQTQNILPVSSELICIESDPKLYSLFCEHYKEESSPNCIFTESPEPLITHIKSGGLWRFRRVEPVVLNGGYSLNKQFYDGILTALNKMDWE